MWSSPSPSCDAGWSTKRVRWEQNQRRERGAPRRWVTARTGAPGSWVMAGTWCSWEHGGGWNGVLLRGESRAAAGTGVSGSAGMR
jgi:hypothetical protein